MTDINYAPVIDDMVWSYSRIKAFEACPYRWYMRYIRRMRGKDTFFATYGSFIHKLIERYYKERLSPHQLVGIYLSDFKKEVVGHSPNQKVFSNYFKSGLQYLKTLEPFPFKVLGIEKKVDFKVDGIPFIGYIDFLGEEKDGSLVIVDNKSRTLKPRSTRSKPTKTDEELDEYLKQLYIYSAAMEEELGKLPSKLCFNCFRENLLIQEPFKAEAYNGAKQWLKDSVSSIREEREFKPSVDYFKCTHLCEMNDECEYYKMNFGKKAGKKNESG